MEDYIKTIDTVVFMAYNSGFCIPRKDIWDIYAVKERLLMYGCIDDEGRYFLNDKGLEYARNGCSHGIHERIKRQNEMERLNIKMQSYIVKKQTVTFWLSIISFIFSFILLMNELGIIEFLIKSISNLL